MARKRYSDEDCLKLLREIDVQLASGRFFRRRAGPWGSAMRYTLHGARSSAAWDNRS